MRRAPRPELLLAVALSLSSAACAGPSGARGAAPSPCDDAWDHTTLVLRAALDEYLAGMRRYAAARDGIDTAPAEERARGRAAAWETARRGEFGASCRAWPPEERTCVLGAASAPGLGSCNADTGALVSSFTDEVVAAFAQNPIR